MTSPTSSRSPNPMLLSTPTSLVRSRAASIIELAAARRMAKTTAIPMEFMRKLTLPHMVTKPALNARSVPVLVGSLEFLNVRSTSAATCGARAGSLNCRTYQPGCIQARYRSYTYS